MPQLLTNELEKIKKSIVHLGTLVEENLLNAIDAFLKKKVQDAKTIIIKDQIIDQMEIEIEEECLKVLALHQPVAKDLRLIVAILKINNDLERIGDLAKNLGERIISLSKTNYDLFTSLDFSQLINKSKTMLNESLNLLLTFDVDKARSICEMDDEVDDLKRKMKKEIKALLINNNQNDALLEAFSIIHYLERVGDLSSNIAEEVVYIKHGEIIRHSHKLS